MNSGYLASDVAEIADETTGSIHIQCTQCVKGQEVCVVSNGAMVRFSSCEPKDKREASIVGCMTHAE